MNSFMQKRKQRSSKIYRNVRAKLNMKQSDFQNQVRVDFFASNTPYLSSFLHFLPLKIVLIRCLILQKPQNFTFFHMPIVTFRNAMKPACSLLENVTIFIKLSLENVTG